MEKRISIYRAPFNPLRSYNWMDAIALYLMCGVLVLLHELLKIEWPAAFLGITIGLSIIGTLLLRRKLITDAEVQLDDRRISLVSMILIFILAVGLAASFAGFQDLRWLFTQKINAVSAEEVDRLLPGRLEGEGLNEELQILNSAQPINGDVPKDAEKIDAEQLSKMVREQQIQKAPAIRQQLANELEAENRTRFQAKSDRRRKSALVYLAVGLALLLLSSIKRPSALKH